MIRFLREKLPKRGELIEHWLIRPFAHLLNHPRHWHIHRNGVSRGIFIGLFCAWSPIPGTQMVIAAIWAAFAHANIPTSVASTWLTNPFTMIPMFYVAFLTGDRMLTWVVPYWESTEFSLTGFWTKDSVLIPMTLGCLICAIVTGFIGLAVTKFIWRRHILAKYRRRLRNRAQNAPAS